MFIGVLAWDVEGDCIYGIAEGGERVPLVFPAGHAALAERHAIIDGAGEVVAAEGDPVELGGGYHELVGGVVGDGFVLDVPCPDGQVFLVQHPIVPASSSTSGQPEPPTDTTSDDQDVPEPGTDRVEVMLYHCGFEPIMLDGGLWEVREGTAFDATNAPDEFVGQGTITANADRTTLTYVDDSGITVAFVPDDGADPGCA